MCGCESWAVKKADSWRIDVFELWCWRRLLRVPWTARRSNQLILKEINPEHIGRTDAEAEAPILWPLATWYEEPFFGKDLDAGKDWGQEEWVTGNEVVGWHHWLNGQEFEQTQGYIKGQGSLVCHSSWGSRRVGCDLVTEQQQQNHWQQQMLARTRATGTLIHCWWECKMVQSLWKSLAISYKTKHTITTRAKIMNSLVFIKMNWKLLSTQKPVQFIAALFIIAKTWKQPKGPSVGEQKNCGTSKRWLFNVKKKTY